MSSRRALQVLLVLLALVVIGTGTLDVVAGPEGALPGNPRVSVNVDSNYRFFAGVWLALGLVLLWVARHVERAGAALRAVCGAVFIGGIARLISLAMAGVPHPMFVAFIGVELIIPPVLIVWQSKLAKPVLADE